MKAFRIVGRRDAKRKTLGFAWAENREKAMIRWTKRYGMFLFDIQGLRAPEMDGRPRAPQFSLNSRR